MSQLWAVVIAILPSIGVGYLFYKIMRTIVESDRNERLAHSRWEAQHAADSPASTGQAPQGQRDTGDRA